MKKLVVFLVGAFLLTISQARAVEVTGAVGAYVPDNENVESAAIGRADAGWKVGDYVRLGISVAQTGTFKQTDIPKEVRYRDANPQAFQPYAGKKFYDNGGDTIIIEGDDITNIFITQAPPILPNRPRDLTERSMTFGEVFLGVTVPVKMVVVEGGARIGAAGVRTYDGESRIGTSKTLGLSVFIPIKIVMVGLSAQRRFVETNVNSYGGTEYSACARIGF